MPPSSCSRFSNDPCAERSSGESLSFTSATSNVLWEDEDGTIVELSVEVVAVVGREREHVGSAMAHDERLVTFEERTEEEEEECCGGREAEECCWGREAEEDWGTMEEEEEEAVVSMMYLVGSPWAGRARGRGGLGLWIGVEASGVELAVLCRGGEVGRVLKVLIVRSP